jgi:hypothetical protein
MDGKSLRIGRFVLGSEDPDIAWRRDNSGKQNVTHETLGGIGTGDNFQLFPSQCKTRVLNWPDPSTAK